MVASFSVMGESGGAGVGVVLDLICFPEVARCILIIICHKKALGQGNRARSQLPLKSYLHYKKKMQPALIS